MYNRYIPQNDGSFHCVEVPSDIECSSEMQKPQQTNFLQKFLPGGLEKDDILILLILLLILQDEQSDSMTVLAMIAAFILL